MSHDYKNYFYPKVKKDFRLSQSFKAFFDSLAYMMQASVHILSPYEFEKALENQDSEITKAFLQRVKSSGSVFVV